MGKVGKPQGKRPQKQHKPKPYNKFQSRKVLKQKRAKLVITNLPFKCTEEQLREHFEPYGEITDINLLKRPDGKLVGCAFIQFKLVQFAKKAEHYTNNHPFMGRNIAVDFAKSKEEYAKLKAHIKEEIKQEENDQVQPESSSEDKQADEVMEVKSDDEDEKLSQTDKKKPFESHDVGEGKTVFVKNIPFDATNTELKECMAQFGRTFYALICMDKLTEHSKGTAFVKFVEKEDAEKALNAGTELTLKGNVLDCHPAMERCDLKNKETQQKELKNKPKDSRHLYLVKEGVILAGTKAAEGVSASDMAKRLQIEQYKTQMLRNLNTFVSVERLVVHNLPASWDDSKLRTLLQKHGGPGCVVKEARVMRDLRKLDANGIGESKRFGFVAFTRHEHALTALRSLNNNPNVFSPTLRPIICFSIESKTALKAKLKRQEKSRLKNPKSKHFDPAVLVSEEKKNDRLSAAEEYEETTYSGVRAKQGVVQKMRSRYKLSEQAKLHAETVKKEKKKQKMTKKSLNERRKDFIKQPKQKINQKSENDNFSKMVQNYKKKLGGTIQETKKQKWFDS